MNYDPRPRHVGAAVEGKQLRRGGEDDIRRHIQAHHRRHGDADAATFGRNTRAPVVDLAPVRVAIQGNFALAGTHHTLKRRAHAVKVHRQLARLHIERHEVSVKFRTVKLHLTKKLRALRIACQPQVGVERSRRFLATGENRIHHRQREVADIHITAEVALSLRIADLHLPVELAVIGQAHQPLQLRAVIAQFGVQIQRAKGHRQRRVVDHLRHFHIAPGQRYLTLRQSLFAGVPTDVGLPTKDPAGLSGVRHKRLQHRQIEAVEINHRAAFRPGIDGLRHAQFSVRVSPAVRPDTDFLFLITVIQRDGAILRPRPDRRLEARIA